MPDLPSAIFDWLITAAFGLLLFYEICGCCGCASPAAQPAGWEYRTIPAPTTAPVSDWPRRVSGWVRVAPQGLQEAMYLSGGTQPATQPSYRTLYVAEDGAATNTGLDVAHPVTLARAIDLYRGGDHLLIHSGDSILVTWQKSLQFHDLSGFWLDVYGGAEPATLTTQTAGLYLRNIPNAHVAFIHFRAASRDPDDAANLRLTVDGKPMKPDRSNAYNAGPGVYLEQCPKFDISNVQCEFYVDGFRIIGDHVPGPSRLAYCTADHVYDVSRSLKSQGIFAQGQLDLTLDHIRLDTCGWEPKISLALPFQESHGLYARSDGGQPPIKIIQPYAVNCANSGITAECGAYVDGGFSGWNNNVANAPNIWVAGPNSYIHNHLSIGGGITMYARTGEVTGCTVIPTDGLPPLILDWPHGKLNDTKPGEKVTIANNQTIGWVGAPVTIMAHRAVEDIHDNTCDLADSVIAQWLKEAMDRGKP